MVQVCDCGNVKSRFEPYCYVCTFKTDYVTKGYQDSDYSDRSDSSFSYTSDHDFPDPMSLDSSHDYSYGSFIVPDSDESESTNQPSDMSLPYNYGNNWVLERPEFFVGSVENKTWIKRLFNTEHFHFKPIEYNEAAENIFKDVLEFARDTAVRIRNTNDYSGQIKVYFTPTTITFKFKPDEYINLEMFEKFDQTQNENGNYQNQGVINANIFSESFKVEIFHDHHNHYQSWSNNMKYSAGSETYEISGDRKDLVLIEYELDTSIFGPEIYTNDMIELLSCHAADTALTHKIPIKIVDQVNNRSVSWGEVDMYTYASYYHVKNPDIVYYGYENENDGYEISENKTTELVVSFVPEGGYHVSFVNGIYTEDGGAHVAAVYKKIRKQLRENGIDVSIKYLKENIEIFMSVWVKNPCFNNQIKSSFHSPTPKIDLEIGPLLKYFQENTSENNTSENNTSENNTSENNTSENNSYCVIS